MGAIFVGMCGYWKHGHFVWPYGLMGGGGGIAVSHNQPILVTISLNVAYIALTMLTAIGISIYDQSWTPP